MTTSNDPGGDLPTVAEIAALTARLRDLSRRGAAASPEERAAFLAEKEALLARIPDADHGAARPDVAETPAMPAWMREHAARTEAELAAGAAPPTRPDDPVDVAERLGELRAAHGPSRTEEIVSRAEAVDRLASAGYDRASAEAMVTEYLHETSRAVGAPVYHWGLDQYDVNDIARSYEWVHRDTGETLVEARERAAATAGSWADRAGQRNRDPQDQPAAAEHAACEAAIWAARARAPQPFTYDQVSDDADGDEELDIGADDEETGFAWTDFYTDEEIAAMGDALDRADVGTARQRLQAYHATKRQQADRHQAEAMSGSAPAEDANDGGESSAAVANRGRLTAEDERREQLAKWHAADSTAQPADRGCDDALERGDLP